MGKISCGREKIKAGDRISDVFEIRTQDEIV